MHMDNEQRTQEQRRVMKLIVAMIYALEESGSRPDDIYDVLLFCLCQFMEHTDRTPQQTMNDFGQMLVRIMMNGESKYEA